MNARAALEAARAAFAPSRGRTPQDATASPTYEALAPQFASVNGRAVAMWRATEHALRVATGRSELSDQALIAEARRLNRLTLGDAHALIALREWVERSTPPPDDAGATVPDVALPEDRERLLASEAFMAVEHALRDASEPLAAAARVAAPSPDARSAAADHPPTIAYRVPPRTPSAAHDITPPSSAPRSATRRGWMLALVVSIAVAVGVGGWALWQRRGLADYRKGVAAFEQGDRSAARAALARAAQQRPNDARPLMLLGRIAREQQDFTQARRYLQAAVRLEPTNALASRELASALLADGEPELARRFYVYAIERDPTDRVAQGFLGCALQRLGRPDLAATWFTRAGAGEWSACAQATPIPSPPQ
ncbi:MAG: tetratricopeptide repeat protein [Gemmatimonadaceae bacterium]|nr:tetratricopeptide repeat protein [Gemmatimonadaceae bacterium]